MPSVDILPSEAKLLELVLKLKEKKLKRAANLIEQAELDVQEAIDSIAERAELDKSAVRGVPRLLRDADGRPARLLWRDAPKFPSQVNGTEVPTDQQVEGASPAKT